MPGGAVRTRLELSASRGVLIVDDEGNPIVSSEMTGDEGDLEDEWPEPKWQRSGEDDEEEGED